jgi:hypothetical protein
MVELLPEAIAPAPTLQMLILEVVQEDHGVIQLPEPLVLEARE